MVNSASQTAQSTKDSASNAAQSAKDSTSNAAQSAKESSLEAKDQAGGFLQQVHLSLHFPQQTPAVAFLSNFLNRQQEVPSTSY